MTRWIIGAGENGHVGRRRGRGRGLAAAILIAGYGACARAGEAPPPVAPTPSELQAQVKALTALVAALARRDREEIGALQAQVNSLQARLAAAQEGPIAANPPPAIASHAVAAMQAPQAAPASAIATAGADPRRAEPRVTQNLTHHFSLQSDDGRYTIGFAGTAQFDVGDYLSFRPRSPVSGPQTLSDGVNARRARIGVSGTAAKDWSYAFVYDAGNSQDTTARGIQTAQIVYGGIAGMALEIGYSNTFFTLDQATSGNDTVFLERATPTNIATSFNTGDFRANAGVRIFGDRYWIGGYLTGPASGDSHTQTRERLGAFQRVAFQALSGERYSLHLGLGVDELLRAPNSGPGTPDTLTLSDQPELRIDPTVLVSTGAIGTAAHPVSGGYVTNVETATTWNNLFWQGEYFHYSIERRGLDSAGSDGGYAQLAWALTGETRRYNPQAGAYYRLFPAHPFAPWRGDFGALEFAGRISYIDLTNDFGMVPASAPNPATINGGRQIGYTLGMSWYPNDLVRFDVNFNHVDFDKSAFGSPTAPAGAAIGASYDAISARSQVTF